MSDVYTTLGFLRDLPKYHTEQPYEAFGHPELPPEALTNCELEYIEGIRVVDAREEDHSPCLDINGFCFIEAPSKFTPRPGQIEESNIEDPIITRYLDDTRNIVQEYLRANRVICFDWRYRKNILQTATGYEERNSSRTFALPPGINVHCDYSYNGGHDRLEMHLLPEELENIRSGHSKAVLMNAWRPLLVVQNAPLMICDRQTVRKTDLVEVDKILSDKVEKGFHIHHRDWHRWYYLSEQTPDELALFKSWVPETPGEIADYPPHGAGRLEHEILDSLRESIEVRMIVIWK
ncbi:hypothetical protein BDV96DRAFT_647525 [Lophiotrema nucula]|uniref:Methyltransferase n=1 Tax=Lophiotrema nucula TaxID=690887 RepID=A0A6A5Z596_9PLEO|nr:hypothetical protein BDV96DRAFT_647525 [Lophiotrema nucula]